MLLSLGAPKACSFCKNNKLHKHELVRKPSSRALHASRNSFSAVGRGGGNEVGGACGEWAPHLPEWMVIRGGKHRNFAYIVAEVTS